jgi:hypothetical protein
LPTTLAGLMETVALAATETCGLAERTVEAVDRVVSLVGWQ